MSPADFATFSNNLIAGASVVYVLAFLSHVGEWALGRSVPVEQPERVPAVVPSGVEAAYAGQAGTYDGQGTPHVESMPPSLGDESRGDEGSRALTLDKLGRIGIALTVLACALHLAGLVTRGLAADPARVPWGNMYEFTIAGSFGVTAIYLLLVRRLHLRWLGLPVTAFAVVTLMCAVLLLYVPAGPLVPALQSYWLVIHVVAAVIAAGGFAVGAMVSVAYLVKDRAERAGRSARKGYVARLPESAVLDRIGYRVHAFAFPLWTFAALVAGPIWAQYAWGRYWGWDPKEVWAFITWVVYAAYLHARATAGWRGKRAAIIALVGFATVLFNFVGINLFGSGLHSYSGLG